MIALAALAVAAAFMVGELWLSTRHERILLAKGAVAAPDPVYREMKLAYPGAFIATALEGLLAGPAPPAAVLAGVGVFAVGKLVKYWAIASLGERWTYRVFALPGAPLVTGGPYRFVRHPNYVGVLGELAGMGLMTGARITGPVSLIYFSWLLLRRIRAEEKALNIR